MPAQAALPAALPQIAVIVGSNRRDSINRKLARALARLGAGQFEATFAQIDDLPMYNQDSEASLAGRGRALQAGDRARRRRAVRHTGA
jgi:NAD(P)H-dependent FMN reductase